MDSPEVPAVIDCRMKSPENLVVTKSVKYVNAAAVIHDFYSDARKQPF